jgi:hypothetical protein
MCSRKRWRRELRIKRELIEAKHTCFLFYSLNDDLILYGELDELSTRF